MRTVNKVTAAVAGVATLVFSLGACSSDDNGGDDTTSPSASDSPSSSDDAGSGDQTPVEVFTWWASGSEAEALKALVGDFETDFPDFKFVNEAAAGGAGSQAKTKLANRLANNDPPDTFQAHAGAELTDYIVADQIEDISDLYDEFGLNDVFPQDLIDRLTVDGKIYSIPANVHRANVVWGSVDALKKAGLDPKAKYDTLADWIKALQQIKDAGVTPLSVGGDWTQVQLLENTLLADLGADGYTGLWDGSTDWSSDDVTQAFKDFDTIMNLADVGQTGDDWPPATKAVEDGDAAFNLMGDWAEAQFEQDGKTFNKDYVAFPTPGTDGVFDFNGDSFTLPKGAPHPDGTKAWLQEISSVKGQHDFNKIKGSIPARTDVDTSDYGDYQQTAIKDFAHDTIVSSLEHGAAVPVSVLNDITEAIDVYGANPDSLGDIKQLQDAVIQAAQDL